MSDERSVVAFLRADPVSRDPLNLRQQQVAVHCGQPDAVGLSDAICDQEGTFLHRAAADLPTGEVRYVGIAFPPEESVAVRRIARLGQVVTALPVELGRVPGVGASLPGPDRRRSCRPPRLRAGRVSGSELRSPFLSGVTQADTRHRASARQERWASSHRAGPRHLLACGTPDQEPTRRGQRPGRTSGRMIG